MLETINRFSKEDPGFFKETYSLLKILTVTLPHKILLSTKQPFGCVCQTCL